MAQHNDDTKQWPVQANLNDYGCIEDAGLFHSKERF